MCRAPPPTPRHAQLVGCVSLLVGASLFASANVLAKAIYGRGASLVSLFLVRGVAVYLLNVALEAFRAGRAAAVRVATLRVGSRRVACLCCLRSVAGFMGITLLNISFQRMVLADSFALTLGVLTLTTVVYARCCLGRSERISPRMLVGGVVGILGMMLVTQPPALFGGASPSLAGVLLAIGAGSLFGLFGVLSRVLGRARTGACVAASPATLVAWYMVVIEIGSLLVALLARAALGPTSPPDAPESADTAWAWARLSLPAGDALLFLLIFLYCVAILTAQLCLAAGYGRLPAGQAAVLSLTEVGFAWLLDVCILREATNALATLGTLVVFVGCALASSSSPAPTASPATPLAAAAPREVDASDWIEGGAMPGAKGCELPDAPQVEGRAGRDEPSGAAASPASERQRE